MTPSATIRPNMASTILRKWPTLLGLGIALAAWQYAARQVDADVLLPTPWNVLETLVADRNIIGKALIATLKTAGIGLLVGLIAATVCALPAVLFTKLKRAIVRQMTIIYCLPLVTIAPLLFLVSSGNKPQIIMAAMSVVFPIFISMVQGLGAPHKQWLDLSRSLGGTKRMYFFRIQVPAAVRELLTAARLAGPAAILGTTLAEYFGGSSGLGVVMINSLSQMNAGRAYALGLTITAIATSAFLLVSVVSKQFFPWVEEMTNEY